MKNGVYWCRKGVLCATVYKCESIVMVQSRFRTQYHNSFINKTGLHLSFIMMSVGTSMILTHRWIGRASQDDSPLLPWPPRSPDLTPCDFFLWSFVKDHVFVPPMPLDLAELRQRIEHAVAGIDHQMLARVWQELDYRIDVCRVINGDFERYSILWHKSFLHVCHGYRFTDSRNPGGTFEIPQSLVGIPSSFLM